MFGFFGRGKNHAVEPQMDRFERLRILSRQLRQSILTAAPPSAIDSVRHIWIICIVSLLAVAPVVVGATYNFNRFIDMEQQVKMEQGSVEAALQRRANLFANLIRLTLSQAAHEQVVFRHVDDVRAELARSNELLDRLAKEEVLPDPDGHPEAGAKKGNLSALLLDGAKSSLTQLMAIVEQYPDIKAASTYQQLMGDLVEIETRIAEQRRKFHEAVQNYNSAIRRFPWYIVARLAGFRAYNYFEATDEVHLNPVVTDDMVEHAAPNNGRP